VFEDALDDIGIVDECDEMRLIPFLLVLCACSSTLTEEQRYERDNRRVMAKEAYELKRRACEEEGGYMVVVHRHGVNTREIPADEYHSAYCARPQQR